MLAMRLADVRHYIRPPQQICWYVLSPETSVVFPTNPIEIRFATADYAGERSLGYLINLGIYLNKSCQNDA
jgi:hypothetical protein